MERQSLSRSCAVSNKQDEDAGEVDEAEKVFRVTLGVYDQAACPRRRAEAMLIGEQAFDLPALPDAVIGCVGRSTTKRCARKAPRPPFKSRFLTTRSRNRLKAMLGGHRRNRWVVST